MCKANIAAYDKFILPHGNDWRLSWPLLTDCIELSTETVPSLACRFGYYRHHGGQTGGRFIWIDIVIIRHNNTYINYFGSPDVQTEEKGSENIRAQTHGHAKRSCRCRFRHIVPRKSILRRQGSPSGPLRDAAPAQHRRTIDRRSGNQLRRFAPNCLSSSVGIRKSGFKWPSPQTPWPQGRTQALRRTH